MGVFIVKYHHILVLNFDFFNRGKVGFGKEIPVQLGLKYLIQTKGVVYEKTHFIILVRR